MKRLDVVDGDVDGDGDGDGEEGETSLDGK